MSNYSVFLNRTYILNEWPPGRNLYGAFLPDTALAGMPKRVVPIAFQQLKHASGRGVDAIAESFHPLMTDPLRFREIKRSQGHEQC